MNRVQRFKDIRHFRTKLSITFLVFLLILFIGIGAVDYSMSSLLSDEQRLGIFSVRPYGEEYYRISIFDNNLYINTKYIARDYRRLANWIESKRQIIAPHN